MFVCLFVCLSVCLFLPARPFLASPPVVEGQIVPRDRDFLHGPDSSTRPSQRHIASHPITFHHSTAHHSTRILRPHRRPRPLLLPPPPLLPLFCPIPHIDIPDSTISPTPHASWRPITRMSLLFLLHLVHPPPNPPNPLQFSLCTSLTPPSRTTPRSPGSPQRLLRPRPTAGRLPPDWLQPPAAVRVRLPRPL